MRMLLAIAALVALSLVLSSKWFMPWRRHPVGAMLVNGGWLVVLLGMFVGPHVLGLIGQEDQNIIRPLALFGLGWVGLMIGLQGHRRVLTGLPWQVSTLALVDALASLLLTAGLAMIVIHWLAPAPQRPLGYVVATLLGVCVMGWSPELRSLGQRWTQAKGMSVLLRGVSGLSGMFALLCWGLLLMLMQPGDSDTISLTALAWGLATSLLVALTAALLSLWLMRVAIKEAQRMVVLLGLVAFVAGAAAVLGYSPLFVAMIWGLVTINLPQQQLGRFEKAISKAEQPVAMMLMISAGVLLDPWLGLVGCVLLLAMLVGRAAVKLGVDRPLLQKAVKDAQQEALLIGPIRQSPVALAVALGFVISAHADDLGLPLTAARTLSVVVLAGLLFDAAAYLHRWRPWVGAKPAMAEGNGATDHKTGGATIATHSPSDMVKEALS